MKRTLCIVIACAAFLSLHAQKQESAVKGKLIDTATGKPISSATVSVLHSKDSSWVTFTISNDMGSFEIKGLEAGSYNVIISHEAFSEIKRRIVITTAQKQVD